MAASVQRMDAAVAETNSILDRLHKIASPGERDYTVQTNVAQLQQVASYISLIRWVTLTVAGIALFIGGLGVGNIMMVTVTERTSEIGVRRALGARRATILRQFLTEAVSLSGLGGIVGIGVGLGMVALGTWLLPRYAPGYGTPDLSWSAVLIAFAISLFIGLAAGGYPALRAARMQPIDALRY
jgi:putative ABC transport system permease protein